MMDRDERDAVIAKLRKQGLTERAIAKEVGMSPANVHWICARLSGKRRDQSRKEMCEECRDDVPVSQVRDGKCGDCQKVELSGVRGVRWHKPTRKWRARIKRNGESIHVGLFATVAEAEAAVIAKRNELHNGADRAVVRPNCGEGA